MRGYRNGSFWSSLNESFFNGTWTQGRWNTGITYYNGFPLSFFDGRKWSYFIDWYIGKGVWTLPYFNGSQFFTGTYTRSTINPRPVPIWAVKADYTNRDNTNGTDYVCTNCGYNGYPAFYSNSGSGSKFYPGGSVASYGWIVNIEWQISIRNWSTPYFSGQFFWNGTDWVGPGQYWDGSQMINRTVYNNGRHIFYLISLPILISVTF